VSSCCTSSDPTVVVVASKPAGFIPDAPTLIPTPQTSTPGAVSGQSAVDKRPICEASQRCIAGAAVPKLRLAPRALKCGQPQAGNSAWLSPTARHGLRVRLSRELAAPYPMRPTDRAVPTLLHALQVVMWKETLTLGMLQKLRGIGGTFRRI
jgi:hypothetical protein